MFDELSGKLDTIFKNLRGQGKLTEKNIKDALRDIRRALLEADVNFKVAKKFLKSIEEEALGTKVLTSITPAQLLVKIVQDGLTGILGGSVEHLQVKGSPEIFMVCGLQGSGKTTSVAKLAHWLRKKGRKPIVSSVDVHRPAAIDQLVTLSRDHDLTFVGNEKGGDPGEIARKALAAVNAGDHDVLIMDTAGRLHIDDAMMAELKAVTDILQPHHMLFVADGMTGQDAVNAVNGFMEHVTFDGVILTKIDGDARGGAALSIRDVTGKPILFVGTGERIEAFDSFYPDRFASRILGMGDIISLVEKAQDVVDEKQALKMQEKILSEGLTLEDFLDQLRQLKQMGPLDQLLGMIPGAGKALKGVNLQDDSNMKRIEAIILSMTKGERQKPHIIDGSRRKRIASGSGVSVQDVNNVLKQFSAMQKMMKRMKKMSGPMKMFRGMNIPM